MKLVRLANKINIYRNDGSYTGYMTGRRGKWSVFVLAGSHSHKHAGIFKTQYAASQSTVNCI